MKKGGLDVLNCVLLNNNITMFTVVAGNWGFLYPACLFFGK